MILRDPLDSIIGSGGEEATIFNTVRTTKAKVSETYPNLDFSSRSVQPNQFLSMLFSINL